MANHVIRFFLLISFLAVKGVEGDYCSYYDSYYSYYKYCPYDSYNYYNSYNYLYYSDYSLAGGTIAGIVIGVIVFIGVIISMIVACCVKAASNGGRAIRGAVVQPIQPTVFTTTTNQAYPMHAYPQAPPTYPQPQPAFQGSTYPPPDNTGSSYPPNAVLPPPAYNNPAGPK